MSSIYDSNVQSMSQENPAASNGGGAYGFDSDPDAFDDLPDSDEDPDALFGGFEMEFDDSKAGYIESLDTGVPWRHRCDGDWLVSPLM